MSAYPSGLQLWDVKVTRFLNPTCRPQNIDVITWAWSSSRAFLTGAGRVGSKSKLPTANWCWPSSFAYTLLRGKVWMKAASSEIHLYKLIIEWNNPFGTIPGFAPQCFIAGNRQAIILSAHLRQRWQKKKPPSPGCCISLQRSKRRQFNGSLSFENSHTNVWVSIKNEGKKEGWIKDNRHSDFPGHELGYNLLIFTRCGHWADENLLRLKIWT